jgi:CheY-like chemotaxis protein
MDRETMDRAFEPFYTTKPVGQGTGLGLSTVYGIVKQAQGYVWLYSEPGHGTTVKLYLPTAGVSAAGDGRAERVTVGGRERVLIIEDEDLVREVTRRSLEEYGYQVVEAPNGQAAVELLRREAPVDLILCDVVLPGLSGPALAAVLERAAPGARLLFMSGYTGLDVELRGLTQPSAPFIQKPFRADDLAAKVRALLDRADSRPSGARLSILE